MKPLPLQNQFSAGMKRDVARSRMPPNSAWNLEDLILDYGAPARERSGWAHASSSVSAASGGSGASYMMGGIYVVFSPTGGADPANLALDEDGHLYEISASGTVTHIGAAVTLQQNPVFHGGVAASAASAVYTGLVIIPDGTGAAVPMKYDGTTLSNLNGSPPKARYACVYKDYTVLGNGTVGSTYFPNRIWFSPVGDPDCGFSGSVTAWDTTDAWIDFSLPVLALAATKNALLVWGDGQVSRIRGTTPPPEEDMVVDDPWQIVGLLDPMSITVNQDQVYWCAPEGVFASDGVTLNDLTLKGGMLRYWLDLVADATTAWTFATGIIRNKLVISVMAGSAVQDGFMIDLNTFAWTRLNNLDATSLWTGLYGVADETYFGRRQAAYVGRLGSMFDTGNATYKLDGDGGVIASIVETPFYELGRPGIKTLKSLFAGYTLKDYGSDNPTITVGYATTPETETYTTIGTLSEAAVYTRRRIQIGGRVWGVSFKLERSGSGDFYGYDLGVEANFQEETKRID